MSIASEEAAFPATSAKGKERKRGERRGEREREREGGGGESVGMVSRYRNCRRS